ncbi:MAG: hypothetical protein JWN06_1351, partial [Propionibacteriaceae bacterium]|nr:hypothetical protein [Propionibacteriaceae bacterium]
VKLVDVLDPDGTLAADRLAQDRRHLQLTANRDGTYTLTGRLTGTTGAALQATLSPLAKPRPDTPGHDSAVHGHEDGRTYGQRLHDALDEVCGRLLRSGGLPDSGGTPATVIVTISAEDLTARTGTGETSDGTLIPAARLLELANEAEILPAVLTAPGECLLLGRSRRIASRHQTYALIARDGGCSFPGCTHPPEWCDRHHIREWVDGGTTDLDNLTLLCRYHHTRFASRGWTCHITNGIPEWTPPHWHDKQQQPLINNRIRRKHLNNHTAPATTVRRQ